MIIKAYLPEIDKSLGLFIPLIVVNCIILGRAESFAAKNGPISSIFDGIGMGLGFTLGLTLLGGAREILGTGAIFGCNLYAEYFGMLMFVLAPGAFLVLGVLVAGMNIVRKKMDEKGKPLAKPSGCITGDCAFRAIATGLEQDYNTTVMEMAELMCETGYALNDSKGEAEYLKRKGCRICDTPINNTKSS